MIPGTLQVSHLFGEQYWRLFTHSALSEDLPQQYAAGQAEKHAVACLEQKLRNKH